MRFLKNMKISKKLLLLNIFSLIFIISVGIVGFYNMNHMSKQMTIMYEEQLLPVKSINNNRAEMRTTEGLVKELMLTTEPTYIKQLESEITDVGNTFSESFEKYKTSKLSNYEMQRVSNIETSLATMRDQRESLYKIIETGDIKKAYAYYRANVAQSYNELNAHLQELADYKANEADKLEKATIKQQQQATLFMIVIMVISAGLAITLGMIITRLLTNPIREVVDVMAKVGKGDLTVKVAYRSKDEIGELVTSLNQLITNLVEANTNILEQANNLAANVQEISSSTEEISTGSQQQAQDASISAGMVSEMTNAVQEVSKNADQAARLADEAMGAARQGGVALNDTIEGMEQIQASIRDLENKSVQIGEIVEVIDDIAEQTNLLALNAAIEAARAGEAGKGFAVVADEVRKLAERSSKATKEISELVSMIQENTKISVDSVETGNEKAVKAGTTFEEILRLVNESAAKVTEIAAASEQQSAQADEVLQAVGNIASVSQETAAGIEEMATSATDLAKMAEELHHVVARFKM